MKKLLLSPLTWNQALWVSLAVSWLTIGVLVYKVHELCNLYDQAETRLIHLQLAHLNK